jgi:ActR/RegA family two-component response regulator
MRRSDSDTSQVILIAAEDDRLRARLSRSFRAGGCRVLEARTSVEALMLAVAYDGPIEALITSLELRTYSNGPELAHCLRVSRPEMRVIFLSDDAYADEDSTRGALLGEATLAPSPVSPLDFLTLVSEIAPRRAAA